MNYRSGETISVGDEVRIEGGRTPGVVIAIVETADEMKTWDVNEAGLFIEAEPFGLVFWPSSDDDPVLRGHNAEHT